MSTDRCAPVRRQSAWLSLAFLLAAVTLFTTLTTGMVQAQDMVETLGETQYTQDTTWTNDRTYILAGSVVVGQGVTLTIQPGTVVKADLGKYIRIDGTLIAQGTADQPIVFAGNSVTNSVWAGIRFSSTAVHARFDGQGAYASGSVIRHAVVQDASTALALAGTAPYIADSRFLGAIGGWTALDASVPSDGDLRIERNRFEGGWLLIGGGASVVGNTFKNTSTLGNVCGIQIESGSPLIMQNEFTEKACGIESQAGWPQVISNTLSAGGGIQLSLSGSASGSAPLPGYLDSGIDFRSIAGGGYHTCAAAADGSVQCWGYGNLGQIGNGSITTTAAPQPVVGLGGPVAELVAGSGHNCVRLADGRVQCWGYGLFGQLGNGSNSNATAAQFVTGLAGPVRQLATAGHFSCALLEDGSVQCWGTNDNGQLGTGANGDANTPQSVAGLGGPVASLFAGDWHTCAVLEDGSVQCWGRGDWGQLGNGQFVNANTPQNVVGLAGPVSQLALGALHTCAILTNGGVQCWGADKAGQLGVAGTQPPTSTPQTVTGLAAPVVQIAARGEHTCALLNDGRVQCWGRNNSGQLGTGDTLQRETPDYVAGLVDVAQVSVGEPHSCALLETGEVKCWGDGSRGQLGAGNFNSSFTPQSISQRIAYVSGNVVYGGAGVRITNAWDGNLIVQQNFLGANGAAGLTVAGDNGRTKIIHNSIVDNQDYGLSIGGAGLSSTDVHGNNLFGNQTYDLYLVNGPNYVLNAANNFWDAPESSIPTRIRDCTSDRDGCGAPNSTVGRVIYSPALTETSPTAPQYAPPAVNLALGRPAVASSIEYPQYPASNVTDGSLFDALVVHPAA